MKTYTKESCNIQLSRLRRQCKNRISSVYIVGMQRKCEYDYYICIYLCIIANGLKVHMTYLDTSEYTTNKNKDTITNKTIMQIRRPPFIRN